jgi:predicted DNA-binding transcriptional regulator AlpA
VSEILPTTHASPTVIGRSAVLPAMVSPGKTTKRSALQAGMEPLLLDARQAAALYGVSRATWHRMVSAGRVPASFRPSPGCVRWRTDELRAHIAAGMPDRTTWEELRAAQRNYRE